MQNSSYDLALHKLIKDGGTPPPDKWVRPSEWPDISGDVGPDNKIVGLVAIPDDVTNNDSVLISFSIQSFVGTFSVDWGDGTINSNIPNGLITHIFNKTSLNLTSTSYGYKVAKVIITGDGGNITNVNLTATPIGYSSSTYLSYTWLEFDISVPNSTLISGVRDFKRLIHCCIRKINNTQSFSNFCSGCYELEFFEVLNNSLNITPIQMNYFFKNCYSLRFLELGVVGKLNNCVGMFTGCYSISSVPLFDISMCNDTSEMFSDCHSLLTTPLYDLTIVTTTQNMFRNCFSLKTVPSFNLSNVINANYMFQYCSSLQVLPYMNLSSATNLRRFVEGAISLFEINNFNPISVHSAGIWWNCPNVARIICKKFGNDQFVPYFDLENYYFLGKDALEEIFTNLPAMSSTIRITNCRGAKDPTLDRTIATSKGWTVVG